MEAVIIFFALLALGMAIMSCVYETRYSRAKKEIQKRDEAEEHDERDEIFYHAVLSECDKKIHTALAYHYDRCHDNVDENDLL